MPPSRNNTVKFSDLAPISAVGTGDLIPVVDTSVPTLVNKKISVQDFSRSLPVSLQVTQLGANSANWDSSYSTTQANSASWGTGGSYGSVYSANSAEYESTYSNVNTNSANWDSAYSTVQASSAAWVGLTTFTTVNSLSDNWSTGYALASSAYTTLSALSTGYWVLKSGDQLTGALTTTRTVTANFTLDELVTKRYVDAMATATQISGNFVPGLYYTKANLETGIPLLSSLVLQTNSLAIGQAGASQTGIISFDANQYGTGVTGYTFNSTGNRSGLRVICGTYARFNVSEQGMSWVWGGPTFQQNLLNLGDINGNSVIAVDHYGPYHAAPLTNSAVLRCNPSYNFFIRNYSNIFLDVPTISGHSFIADQYAVQNDGRIYNAFASPAGHNIQFASNNFFFTGNNVRTLSIAENIAPGNGGIWMRSDRIVGWSSSGDPGNTGDLRLKRIGTSSLALDSGGTANIPSFTVFGDISAGRDMFSTSLQSNSNLLLSAVGNITLSAASIRLSQNLPFYFASLSASKLTFDRGPAPISNPHISVPAWDNNYWISDNSYSSIWGGSGPSLNFNTQYNSWYMGIAARINGVNNTFNLNLHRDLGITWSPSTTWNETGDLFLFRDAPYVLAIRDRQTQTGTNALRIYNNYTDSSNYTRLSLSGSRVAFEYAGTGSSSFDSSIRKGAYGGIAYYLGNTWVGMFPGETGDFHLNSTKEIKWGTGEQWWAYDLSLARDEADRLALRRSTNNQAFRIYNTYTDANNYERLSLSATRIAYEFAGTGVSRDLTIQSTGNIILSAGGVVNISTGIPTMFATLSARDLEVGPMISTTPFSGVFRMAHQGGQFGTPGMLLYQGLGPPPTSFTSSLIFASFGGGGPDGFAQTCQTGAIVKYLLATTMSVNPNPGSTGHWEETIPNMAIKTTGLIGFSVPGVDGSGTVRPLSATMGYDWSTNLISLSSRTSVQGFTLPGKSAQNGRCAIYSDSNDFLNLAAWSGAGKSIRFGDINTSTNLIGGIFGQVSYSGWQMINMSLTNFAGYTATDTLVLNQITNQTGSYFKANNSSSSTIFEINSANNVVVRNLLALGGTTASNAAIKASGTTVVAKLGDDSDYAFLQGKLQTLNTAAAGTFTPDKYIILYDSTGTAYKVPVQAL